LSYQYDITYLSSWFIFRTLTADETDWTRKGFGVRYFKVE